MHWKESYLCSGKDKPSTLNGDYPPSHPISPLLLDMTKVKPRVSFLPNPIRLKLTLSVPEKAPVQSHLDQRVEASLSAHSMAQQQIRSCNLEKSQPSIFWSADDLNIPFFLTMNFLISAVHLKGPLCLPRELTPITETKTCPASPNWPETLLCGPQLQ